ncbi:DEAD/DEAH box helicase [Dankookia sp. P2]|uniref:DEAD/DEAH box helicase n=1 Tax=Dankookia sp. P2 TaxID=3423955 RepID=UPI003D670815
MQRALRSHQQLLAGVVEAIATGQTDLRDILAAVTPGGGKSLLPVIAAARLMAAGLVERVCWIVPRDSLRLQAEEAFADPAWRDALSHAVSVRAAENAPDPCRGLQGWITTYQGVAAAPELHLAEFRRHRTLLVVDEVHHLPAEAVPDAPEEAAWSRAILPLLETAAVRLLLSGTLERADGRPILWLPYRKGQGTRTREVDLAAPGFAVIGYSRAQALAEKAVLPVDFGALDGEAEWLDEARRRTGPHPVSGPPEVGRAALFTALRTGFARDLLRRAFAATRDLPGRTPSPARPAGGRDRDGPRQAAGGGAGPGECAAIPGLAARLAAARPGGDRGAHRHLRRARRAGGAGRLPVAARTQRPRHRRHGL